MATRKSLGIAQRGYDFRAKNLDMNTLKVRARRRYIHEEGRRFMDLGKEICLSIGVT